MCTPISYFSQMTDSPSAADSKLFCPPDVGEVGALPLDIFHIICDYVFQTDRAAFDRLCLCSRNSRTHCVAGISVVNIDYSKSIRASSFVGAAPESVFIRGAPIDAKEGQLLGTLVSKAKKVSFKLEGVAPSPSREPLMALGPFLSSVSMLDIEYTTPEMNEVIRSWLDFTKNLTSLGVSWFPSTGEILAAAGSACGKLTSLRLKFKSLDCQLQQLASFLDGVTALPSVETLVLDLSSIRGLGLEQLNGFKKSLDSLKSRLPASMQSLHNVFIRQSEPYKFDAPLFAFLYAHVTEDPVSEFLLEKILEMGPDRTLRETGTTALVCLLSAAVYEHHHKHMMRKIRRLIEAGADPLQRVPLPGFSDGPSWGNSLHFAAIYCRRHVVDAYLAVLKERHLHVTVDTMRTAEGFTPLHFAAQDSECWIALSEYMKRIVVSHEILTDNENILRVTPFAAIHLRSDPEITSAACVVSIAKYMLENEPWASDAKVKAEKANLFGRAVDFFSSYLGTLDGHSDSGDYEELWMDRPYFPSDEISSYLSEIQKFASSQCATNELDKLIGRSHLEMSKRICGAILFLGESTRDEILASASKDELSTAFVKIPEFFEFDTSSLSDAWDLLLKFGADPNFVHPAATSDFSVLTTLVRFRGYAGGHFVDPESFGISVDTFWSAFFHLTSLGVSPDYGAPENTLFLQQEFIYLLELHLPKRQIRRLKQWLQKLGASKEVETLDRIVETADHYSDSSDDENSLDDSQDQSSWDDGAGDF